VVGMGFKLPGMPPPPKGEAPKPINICGVTFPATDPPVLSNSPSVDDGSLVPISTLWSRNL